ncbi:MAG TPA: hypothetical protein DCK95_05675 [Anaerolineaceae bacterium]|nr:hypothetical protein [Anaerolineaceae bacterium]
MLNDLFSNLRFLWNQWAHNHRYHGGLKAMAKCALGTINVNSNQQIAVSSIRQSSIESLTFSVFPQLTAIWSEYFVSATKNYDLKIRIGDCSGGDKPFIDYQKIIINPFLNIQHGKKIDIFLNKLISSQYVILCDDDVFWLNSEPLDYALRSFKRDPEIAVVSLMPRDRVSSVLQGKINNPMGSYCLVIRNDIWKKENLSFKIKDPQSNNNYDWFYDTGDYANIELIKRGYKVCIAEEEIRQNLVSFEGISSWLMKIQKHRGEITNSIQGIPIRMQKAFRAILVAEKINNTLYKKFESTEFFVMSQDYLNIAKKITINEMSSKIISKIEGETDQMLSKLLSHLPSSLSRKVS